MKKCIKIFDCNGSLLASIICSEDIYEINNTYSDVNIIVEDYLENEMY